jgi:hypothetical protein
MEGGLGKEQPGRAIPDRRRSINSLLKKVEPWNKKSN